MVAPFHDGSKCLVRDLCLHLSAFEPHVMTTGVEVPELCGKAKLHAVYSESGGFSPLLRQNMQAAAFMLLRSRADLWHFMFAPNPRSSGVARALKKLRRIPTLQTIASPPRSFAAPQKLLFGDICVAQSDWTKAQFEASFAASNWPPPRIEVIYPPAPEVPVPSSERMRAARRHLGISEDAPLLLYPGDLEVSRGAERSVRLAKAARERIPGAYTVIAYRDKTPRAHERARALKQGTDPDLVRFACNVPDIHALVATSRAVLFPVEDLYGKVDLPIILLEAMRFSTPVLALSAGPLQSLKGALLLGEEDEAWLSAMAEVCVDGDARRAVVTRGLDAVADVYAPENVARKYEQLYASLL